MNSCLIKSNSKIDALNNPSIDRSSAINHTKHRSYTEYKVVLRAVSM